MIWQVAYAHDREIPGKVSYIAEVDAPDEERAIMRAGMARAESMTNEFLYWFYYPHRVKWTRLWVKQLPESPV